MTKSIIALVHSENAKSSLQSMLREVAPKAQVKIIRVVEDLMCTPVNNTVSRDADSNETGRADTIFIEFCFPLSELSICINALKLNVETRPDKIILVVGRSAANQKTISDHLSLGFSGILSMPFSVDNLNEVLEISGELNMKGSIARLKVATGLQIKSLLESKGAKFEESSILKAVKKACKKFEKDNPGQNVDDIAEEYAKMEPHERLSKSVTDIYKGVSGRVKKLVERK